MTQHAYSICLCSECQRLDRLPIHRQGIPGAKQLTLVGGPVCSAPLAMAEPAPDPEFTPPPADPMIIGPNGVIQRPLDSLPLFGGGSDAPYLL